jgi:hypothetical protein
MVPQSKLCSVAPKQATETKAWARISRALGAPEAMTDKSTIAKRAYGAALYDFEQVPDLALPLTSDRAVLHMRCVHGCHAGTGHMLQKLYCGMLMRRCLLHTCQ